MGKKSKAKGSRKGSKKSSTPSTAKKNKKGRNGGDDPFGSKPSEGAYDDSAKSIYQLYKAATDQFKARLSGLVPARIFASDNVQNFMDAVDYVKDNGISVDGALLRNLRVAVSVREKYTSRLEGGGDEGHAYFVLVLNYCLQVLKSCVRAGEGAARSEDVSCDDAEEQNEQLENRFGALALEADGHDGAEADEDDDDDDDDKPAVRPAATEKVYTYEDLLHIPDRTKCMHLIYTIAFRADQVRETFGKGVKEFLREGVDDEGMATTLTTMGITLSGMLLDVERVEKSLYIDCPDLAESPYRVLAVAFLGRFVNLVADNARKQSPLGRKFRDEHAIAFIARIVEASFKGEQPTTFHKISGDFAKRWKLPEHWRKKNLWLTSLVLREALKNNMTVAERDFPNLVSYVEDDDPTFPGYSGDVLPTWMDESEKLMRSISGDFSILNTMKVLVLVPAAMDGAAVDGEDGEEKEPFSETLMTQVLRRAKWDDLATRVRGDLDGKIFTLITEIVHSVWGCNETALPSEDFCLPLVAIVRKWTRDNIVATPPSFTLTFAVHSMLLSIFELQGDSHLERMTAISKKRYESFFDQVGSQLKSGIPCGSDRESCLKFIQRTRRIVEPNGLRKDEIHSPRVARHMPYGVELLCWNPFSAVLLLGYNATALSLEGGLAVINSSGQAASILHIYNALRVCGLVDELPMLSDIDRHFSDVKQLFWNGWEKPQKGKFTYRYHLSWGLPHEMALWYQNQAKQLFGGGSDPGKKPKFTLNKFDQNRQTSKRVATFVDPCEVSGTYKFLKEGNFDIVERRDVKFIWRVAEDMNSSLGSGVLKYNWVAVGEVIDEFLFKTFNPENNENLAKLVSRRDLPVSKAGDIRGIVNTRVTEEIIGMLDYAEDPSHYDHFGKAFKDFFQALDMKRVLL